MALASLVISIFAIIVSIAGIIVSYRVAKKYGDLAAVEATRRFHEEDLKRARLTALQSLVNEVARIRKLAEHNSQLAPSQPAQPVARMPVAAFETAFVSGAPGLEVSLELLDTVTDYLACADSINSLVDIYVAGTPSGESASASRLRKAVEQMKEICASTLPEILDRLRDALQRELETASQQ